MIYLAWPGILFSTTVRAAVVVAKLVILDILFLKSYITAVKATVEAKLVTLVFQF